MLSYFLKKKEDEETGHYTYMRKHKPVLRKDSKMLSDERINRLSLYQSAETRKKVSSIDVKQKMRPEAVDALQRRSNSTKFKSLN